MFVNAQLLMDSPDVLYLGKLCEEHGYPYERKEGQAPHLLDEDLLFLVIRTISVPNVAPVVTKDEVISASADGSGKTSRSSASGVANCIGRSIAVHA